MQKKRVLLLIVALLVVVLSTTALFACNKDENKTRHALDLEEGTYPSALPSNFQGDELATVTAGLSSTASVADVKAAVFAAYNVANRSRLSADLSLMIQHTESGSGISAMTFNGYTLRSGNAWYYQLPREAAFDGLSNTQVAYTLDRETFYYAKLDSSSGAKCHDIDVFPYGEFILIQAPKPYDFDGYREHRFFLDDQLELCNMKLILDLIDETSSISFDATEHIYTVKLNIDCDGGDPALLKEWAAQAQAEANSEMEVERKYEKWDAVINIWENGYVKSLEYDEYWTGKIGSFNLDGPAKSYFKFFYEEDEIMALLKQDSRYGALSEEKKELMTTPRAFIEMYCGAEIGRPNLVSWHIALIVLSCIIFAVIVIVVTIEILVKKGKLPKLAAKREAAKQKKLAKKQAKAAKKAGVLQEQLEETNFVEDEIPVEPAEETAESKEEQAEEQTPEE